jgi:hypothetical protein
LRAQSKMLTGDLEKGEEYERGIIGIGERLRGFL